MKLTIKSGNGQTRVVDLEQDLQFNTLKGEQYIFSKGFNNYVLNFKDNQESIELIFNVDGKTIKVDLKGIVPHLQENVAGAENPTVVIINKNVNDKDLDSIVDNDSFNGSEIIDRLEELLSKPVELDAGTSDLTLISDFQTLVEALDAAAAGANEGNTSDGSSFQSLFNPISDSLRDVAQTDRWVNLSEEISTLGLDTGDNTPPAVIPEISISDSVVNEKDGEISFTISLSQSTTNTVLVNFSTADGTAKSILDYINSSGPIIFLPGETVKTITIPVINDDINEISENFFINLDTSINATIADGQAQGTIIDDDIPSISVGKPEDIGTADITVPEGSDAVFAVEVSKAAVNSTLTLTLADGTALDADYFDSANAGHFTYSTDNGTTWITVTGPITLSAGDTNILVSTDTIDDLIDEANETFTLTGKLTSNGSDYSDTATATIIDNDEVTVKSVTSDTKVEGEELVHTVTLTGTSVNEETFAFTLTNGTVENEDIGTIIFSDGVMYDASTGKITVPAGVTSFTITTPTVDDALKEDTEAYTLSVGGKEATGTILDNDVPLVANNNTATATETGNEFVSSEDEINDGLKAIGNVITDGIPDEGSNPLFITKIKFEGNEVIIPQNGSDITIQGDYGTLTINKSGSYKYEVNENTTDSWNTNRSEDDVFTYTLSDGYNPDDEATLTVKVEGKNDAPVINSISANNKSYKEINGLLDANNDDIVDTLNPDDLTNKDKVITFSENNGNLKIDMGTTESSMSVEYNGGQAGYHNVLGYYTKDENGNIEAHIIYVEDESFVGSKSEMLGTLKNLVGEVGFFIIPNGENNSITMNSTITVSPNGEMIVDGVNQTVYYSDNELNSDGKDHVIAAKSSNGGIVIAFEDLNLGDKDYDDVVITIKPCESLGTVTKTTLLLEDFENIVRGTDETVGGTGWYVDNGTAGDGILVSSNENQWQLNNSGIEIRENNVIHSLDTVNGSDTYIELDAHTNGINSSITTQVDLGSNDTYDLSFNFTPRPGAFDSSDMQFSLDGKIVEINVDSSGNVTFNAPSGVNVEISSINGTPWYKIEATFSDITSSSAELSFKATGNADTLGAYIDNIELIGNDYSTANTILSNIDLSDVDNSTLETATVTLTNYKNGDVIGTDNLPSGITATVTNGVVVLTGTATISAYEDALKSLTFTSTSSDRTPRDFEITVNDGSKTSNTMELHLDIGGCEINPGEYSQSINILIESNGDVKENESVTFTVKIDKSINEDTIVTLSNGDKVTIEAGKTSAIYTLPSQGDDVFKDPSSVTISVESAEVPTNSNITLNINNSVAKVDISDTIDKVYAVISVDKSSIIEGGTLVYTVKLVDENGTEVTVPNGKNVNVEIDWSGNASNGSDTSSLPSNINIIGGTSSTSFDVITLDDKYYEGNEPLIATITKVTDSDSIFESLNIGTNKTANSQIIDNDNFSLSIDSVMVDEDALLGTDDADSYDPDIKEFTGSLGLNVEDTSSVNLMFEGGQSTSLTSQGEKISLQMNAPYETLKGISADGREIFEITLNESNGTYTFKLKDVVDHPDINSEDLISSLGINVIAIKDSAIISAKINISIADDIPRAESVVIDAESKFATTSTNLVLAIDISGSMGSGTTSKMELAKEAAIKLIEKYEEFGNVNIKIVSFNGTSSSTIWFTSVQDAKNSILGLNASGNTDYEDLLDETINNFNTVNDSKPTADQDIFYMLSDGNPTEGDANGSDNISGILSSWKDFAEANFDDVYTIGIGTNVDLDGNSRGSLEEIGDVSVGHEPFIVEDVNDLTDELLATIVNIKGELVLNTGDNKLDFSFGADGPADGTGIKKDENKIAFSWGDSDLTDGVGVIINNNDGSAPSLTWLVYNNGKVILGKDINTGEILIKLEAKDILSDNPTYEVTQFKANTGINKIEIPYTVVDGDGDGSTANLTINIDYSNQNTPPEAEDRHIEVEENTAGTENSASFTLKDFVKDIEDDSTSTIVKIRIESLPEDGVLTVGGNPVKIGDIYDETVEIKYTANDNLEDTLYGTVADTGTISDWGTITNGVLVTNDGKATIKAFTAGQEIDFASENNNYSHDGLGIGVDSSSGDDDQIDKLNDEKIVIEFKTPVSNAEFGLASLGDHFKDSTYDAKAQWVAKDANGNVVASGFVQQSTDDSNPYTNSFKVDVEFSSIEFFTTSNASNSNFSIQYMNIDYKVDDSFDYVAIDSDGLESEKATVTFDIDSKGNIIPKTTDDSIITDEDTSYTIKVEDFGNYSDSSTSSFIKVMIVDLPTNGVLKLNGAVISENTEILKSDIDSGNLVFEPNSQSDVDGSFTFKVSNGTNYSETNTVSIDVKAVADKPTATIEVKEIEIVTGSNLIENGSFEDISGKDANGNVVASDYDISSGGLVTRQEITGWKVVEGKPMEPHDKAHAGVGSTDGDNYMDLGASPGNSTIAQTINGLVEGQVYSLSVDYLDKAAKQGMGLDSGKMEVIWNGKVIATIDGNNTENWETLKIDLTAGSGDKTDTLQFKEIGSNNDNGGIALDNVQLIEIPSDNKEYDVNISAALGADNIDGSEILTVKIDGVPSNATLTSSTYTLTKNADGSWTVEVPNGVKSIEDNSIKLVTPKDTPSFDLTITARAIETNDNNDGLNYKESSDTDSVSTISSVDETQTVRLSEIDTNLVITFDTSGSMSSKMALAKEATINMINEYEKLGEVKILLTTFNSFAETLTNSNGSVWLTAEEAKNFINSFNADGGTNYDDALLDVIKSIETEAAPLTGNTVSYFISDGVPTYGMTKNSDGTYTRDGNGSTTTDITDDIASAFKNLGFDETYSVGIGATSTQDYLAEIAIDGNADVIIVNNANDLNGTLSNTVTTVVNGNALDNVDFKGNTGYLESIIIDSKEYTSATLPANGIVTSIGVFNFDFATGDYTYNINSSSIKNDIFETITINAKDSIGAQTSFNVNINVDISPYQANTDVSATLPTISISLGDVIEITTQSVQRLSDIENLTTNNSGTNVYVSGDLNDDIDLDNRAHIIEINGSVHDDIDLGDSSDTMNIDGSVNDDIDLNKGNDRLDIDGNSNAQIKMDQGNYDQSIRIGGDINSDKKLEMGDGEDTVDIYGNVNNKEINLGSGNDKLFVSGSINNGKVDAGSGDDVVVVYGRIYRELKGGSGDDILFVNLTKDQWNSNSFSDKNNVSGFETIIFNDGTYIGNSSLIPQYNPFINNSSNSITSYEYPVVVSILNNDLDSETITEVKVSFENLPIDGKIYQNGVELIPNNGEYTLNANDLTNIKISSSEQILDESGFKVNVCATSTESNGGSIAIKNLNTLFIGDENNDDTIDFTTAINNKTDIDVVDIKGTNVNTKLKIDIEDLVADTDKELIIKGEFEGKVDLNDGNDGQKSWENSGTENLDGSTYNVYIGTGVNSTVKLLIEDDIEIIPDI